MSMLLRYILAAFVMLGAAIVAISPFASTFVEQWSRRDVELRPSSPQPPPLLSWDVYRAAAKLRPLGTVEAADEDEAIEKAAAQFKVIASKLIAVRRR